MDKIITYSLSDNFLERLADFAEGEFLKKNKDMSRVAFVFGGRRPALFLTKELSRRIKKGFALPKFFSIDEFVEYIVAKKGPFIRLSDLDACYIIYKLAGRLAPDILSGRESFSKFLPWARQILSFIEQLDLEDIKTGPLEDIQSKADIGYDIPENINAMLKSIVLIRGSYHRVLEEKNAYSRGLMYLAASRRVKDMEMPEFDDIVFCGFFYLHKTEADIIKYLYDAKKSTLVFQGGAKDWSVLNKVSQGLSSVIEEHDGLKAGYKLSLHAGFDVHSEVSLVREIIKGIDKKDKTVIVLPDSGSIIPLLSEIAFYSGDFNVSMGYPLGRSSLYSLFEFIFKAQETKKDGGYYATDYLKVLSHPLVKSLRILPNPAITRVLVHKIEEVLVGIEKSALGGNLFFKLKDIHNSKELYESALSMMKKMDIEISRDELKLAVKELHDILFEQWEDIGDFRDFSASLGRLLDILLREGTLGSYPLNLKMAEKLLSVKEELSALSFIKEPFPKEDIFKVFDNRLASEMISFSGSPLKGLQILGLFETRSLNFDNVIIMDANEAALPNLKIYEPLIPREVMINLGLNRLEKEEEIQRYQFRRLIAQAKNVHIIYQERDDKEKSRFIEELAWEKEKKLGSLEVLTAQRASFKVKVLPKRSDIKKSADVVKFLEGFRYSASSVNTYLGCPLRFYYQYVLGIEEKAELAEEPEGKDIGTFIHELLEDTYARFVGKKPYIDKNFRDDFFAALDKKFADEFEKKMRSDAFLIKEILTFRMGKFLDAEKERDVREILCLEKKFEGKIKLSAGNFKFIAIVDRIDRLSDGSALIIDYKTGATDIMPEINSEKIIAAGFTREALKKSVRSFQLPLYLYFAGQDKKYNGEKINAALYAIKDAGREDALKKLFKKEEQFDNKDKLMGVYADALGALVSDILNPDISFKADEEDAHNCGLCPFFYLCR